MLTTRDDVAHAMFKVKYKGLTLPNKLLYPDDTFETHRGPELTLH